jgi:ABC-type enterochelin transport system ATPase subunit
VEFIYKSIIRRVSYDRSKNINKSYGNKKVLEDVSFKIEEGKITSFIGPNGAGKSTILSIYQDLWILIQEKLL